MKFGRDIVQHSVPEWEPGYVNYKHLKKRLKAVRQKYPLHEINLHPGLLASREMQQARLIVDAMRPSAFGNEASEVTGLRYSFLERERLRKVRDSKEEHAFLVALEKELSKVNRFFSQRWEEMQRQRESLDLQLLAFYVTHAPPGQVEQVIMLLQQRLGRESVLTSHQLMTGDTVRNLQGSAQLRRRFRRRISASDQESELQSDTARLKEAFKEFYRLLDMLTSYQHLNRMAFEKALKKHDKYTGLYLRQQYMAKVEKAKFWTTNIESLMKRVEQEYTECLAEGDRHQAMKQLRVPHDTFYPFDWTMFRLGSWAMFFFCSCLVILIAALRARQGFYPAPEAHFTMFRGQLYPTIMTALIAVNIYVWKKVRINYLLIFGLDHRDYTNHIQLMEQAGFLASVWSVGVLLYLFSKPAPTIPSPYLPITLLAILLVLMMAPLGTTSRRANKWAARTIGRMVAAPFFAVRFEDFWLADQLNSVVIFLLDLQYTFCYVTYGQFRDSGNATCRSNRGVLRPILAALPAWIRFAQCIRRYRDTKKAHHLTNAGKYFSSMFVTVMSSWTSAQREHGGEVGTDDYVTALFSVWMVAAVVSTCYSLYWDLTHDWGLFPKDPHPKYRFLRKRLLYDPKLYYIAIALDTVLRFLWTLSVSVGFFGSFFSDGLVAILALSEMFRRFMWNFFRLENEHLYNCGEFRVTRVVDLPFSYDDDDDDDVHVESVSMPESDHEDGSDIVVLDIVPDLPSLERSTLS